MSFGQIKDTSKSDIGLSLIINKAFANNETEICSDALGPCASGEAMVCDAKDEWHWWDDYKECTDVDVTYCCPSSSN